MSTIGKKLQGLFTKEDKFNIHKVLGVSCFGNFLYRLAYTGSRDMAFGPDLISFGWIMAHLSLSLTSLIFHIPAKRIKDGSRIWPEYRLHSIIFASRSIAGLLVTWAEARYEIGPFYMANVAIIFATMMAADASSHFFKSAHSNTIRDMDTSPAMRYFYSFSQIHGTTYCLVGLRRYTTQYVIVWVVQFTAFMMTLRRKNIFSHRAWVIIYATILGTGFAVSLYDTYVECDAWFISAIANVMVILRLNLGCPKYLMWGLCAGLIHLYRITPSWEILYMWNVLTVLSSTVVFMFGYLKASRQAREQELSNRKQEVANNKVD